MRVPSWMVGRPGFEVRMRFGVVVWAGIPAGAEKRFGQQPKKPRAERPKPKRRERPARPPDRAQREALLEVYGQSRDAGAGKREAISEANALVAIWREKRLGAPAGTGAAHPPQGDQQPPETAKGVEPECAALGNRRQQELPFTFVGGQGLPLALVGEATGDRRSHADEVRPIVGPYAPLGRGPRTALGPAAKQTPAASVGQSQTPNVTREHLVAAVSPAAEPER